MSKAKDINEFVKHTINSSDEVFETHSEYPDRGLELRPEVIEKLKKRRESKKYYTYEEAAEIMGLIDEV